MKKLILLLFLVFFPGGLPAMATEVSVMSKEELKDRLGSEVTVLDVRSGRDWSSSEFKIKGAARASGSEIGNWSKELKKDQTLVLYCA